MEVHAKSSGGSGGIPPPEGGLYNRTSFLREPPGIASLEPQLRSYDARLADA
jgi:hypothetical protein